MSFITSENISANLDNFIKDFVVPDWQKINSKQHYEHQSKLLHNLSIQVFNTDTSIVVASNLMFYLCPTQPFIPMTSGYLVALEELGFRPSSNSYIHYSQAFSDAVTEHRSELSRSLSGLGNRSEGKAFLVSFFDHLMKYIHVFHPQGRFAVPIRS